MDGYGHFGECRFRVAGHRYHHHVNEPPIWNDVRQMARRPLRIFPFDPMIDRFSDPVVCKVPYEVVTPGPVGRLVEVVDFDSVHRQWLPPLDLDSAEVLIGQGLAPSEADPRSHQQMVYAVSMRVLETFEQGLGRPFDWLDKLRLLPHGLDGGNVSFDAGPFEIVFGYFTVAQDSSERSNLDGQPIFSCLSYDLIAGQVCYPVLNRVRPLDWFAPDPDTAGLAAGMCDLIAILVRFTEPDVVARTIRAHGASLRKTPLLNFGAQFGAALTDHDALRSYPQDADPEQYQRELEPHARGMLLTSAFLEAFLGTYDERTVDLLQINGGVPPIGYMHPDLVLRLSGEATRMAARVAQSAIAALDWLPPVGLTFYDVLRAVLATDTTLFGKDGQGYRSRLIEAFHKRGMIPRDPGSLATEAFMLSPVDPVSDRIVPHTEDVLLHVITTDEYRREFTVRTPPKDVTDRLATQIEQKDSVWRHAIETFARANMAGLRLEPARPVRLVNVCGSYQRDSVGNLIARVFVTLVQDGESRKRPLGVTLVCDSEGSIRYILGGKPPRRRPYRPPAELTPSQRRFAATQPVGASPPENSASALWTALRAQAGRPTGRRPLRVIPYDPMVDRAGRSVVADVVYETVGPGPAGRLVEVIDYDPVHHCWYEPIDLDAPSVMLNSGLDVAEADPRFHQQMVYAVVVRVLETFERALGRPFRWRGTRRLRVYPHAFVGENAYFDEDLFALLFGYFAASEDDPGPNLPGQTVFTALSHDIIAHETTHAVVNRLRKHYSNPTNLDVLAFHEGFADIMAILQHFTYPEIVAEHIAATRADLTDRTMSETNPLLSLASQFGYASGSAAPLRTALMNPDTNAYRNATEEHDRGAVLVAAVIDGFMRSYHDAIADLLRIATSGSGVLKPGALHPDLVKRIADTASVTADRVAQICIRAFDYLPPVDITFSDYLRALVTSDTDLFPDDTVHLRSNLIEGFRARGIYPAGVASLAERSLRLERRDPHEFPPLPFVKERLLDAAREFDRRRRSDHATAAHTEADSESHDPVVGAQPSEWAAREDQDSWATALHGWAMKHWKKLGLAKPTATRPIAVDGFFTSQRMDADGYPQSQITVQFVQRDHQEHEEDLGGLEPMGGVTVVADGEGIVRYVIPKMLQSADDQRMAQLKGFAASVENRLTSAKWSQNPSSRIVQRLNLRSLDARG
ncbi:MAG: hypothetical protein QOK33_5187 [Mycobacterium sp.]|nr:hypothetical protein [Mycobacterium sp.]